MEHKVTSWYIQFQGSEFGPFDVNEVRRTLQAGKIRGAIYLWCKGQVNWTRVRSVGEFEELLLTDPLRARARGARPEVIPFRASDDERRVAGRFRLIATVSDLRDPADPYVGVCADISSKGVGVLLDHKKSFTQGEAIPIEIDSLSLLSLRSFRADSRVAWISMDGKSLGFEFLAMDAEIEMALNQYVSEAAKRLGNL